MSYPSLERQLFAAPWVRLGRPIAELAAGVVGFAASGWALGLLRTTAESGELAVSTDVSLLLSGLVFGTSFAPLRGRFADSEDRLWDLLAMRLGLNLLLQSLLSYSTLLEPMPINVVALGGMLSVALISALRAVFRRHEPGMHTVMIGDTPLDATDAQVRGTVTGVARNAGEAAELIFGGGANYAVVGSHAGWSAVPLGRLINAWSQGVVFRSAEQLWEWRTERVLAESVRPTDLRWFTTFTASRSVQAMQAVYSNLIGLALLIGSLPLFLPLAVISRSAAGSGSLLDSAACSGFQGVAFWRYRFHARRADGTLTGIGGWLQRTGLVNLPQLVNVVRGEMAILGPAPMTVAVAERLRELVPFSVHRLTVRPGLFGWEQLHRPKGVVAEEIGRLEYDLFYLKEHKVAFDMQILASTLTGLGR